MIEIQEVVQWIITHFPSSLETGIAIGVILAFIADFIILRFTNLRAPRRPEDDPPPTPKPTEKHVYNEQTKLLATALNTAGTSCFTVGIATPIAGYLYNVSNLQTTLDWRVLAGGAVGWLIAAVSLHLFGRRALKGLQP